MSELIECSHHALIYLKPTLSYLCETAAVKQCAEEQDFFNFFKLYWCTLSGNLILLLILTFLSIFFIFKYTSIVVDEYIAEGIQEISEFIGFSEALAAITLLAFANGAGDVITALVAGDSEGGVSYNIGALYGAGLFVCSMVVAVCILQNNAPLVYDKMIIYRDIGFYIIATIATIVFAFDGKITVLASCVYLGIYVAMVIFVIIWERMHKKEPVDLKQGKVSIGQEQHIGDYTENPPVQVEDVNEDEDELKVPILGNKMRNKFKAAVNAVKFQNHVMTKIDYRRKQRHEVPLKEKSIFNKILHILDYPINAALYLTAAPSNKHNYTKLRACIYPIFGFSFYCLIALKEISLKIVYFGLIPGLVLAFIFFFVLPKDGSLPKWKIVLVVLSVLSGLAWTYLLVGLLIDLLNCIGVVLNLDKTFLGLTILAVGNALPDALTTIALVKQGVGTLAISGGYAGQLFGLLVGFGISMLKLTLKEGPQEFELFNKDKFKENLLDILVVGVAFFVLLLTFGYGVVNRFSMNRPFALILLTTYAIFIAGCLYVAVNNAIKNP